MLKIQSLASGSRGNAIYVASDTTKILVDVGLTLPQLLRRMEHAQIDPATIDAILITHEHGDHTAGLAAFLKRFNCIVHIHEDTAEVFGSLPPHKIRFFGGHTHTCFEIGDITVDHFPVSHDSRFCFGYTFTKDTAKISIATDLGRITECIIDKMANSQIVMLESNHDILKLTHNTKYPAILKRRITSSNGHLSNAASSLAIYELAKRNVQQFILAHLSEQNNSPHLAYSFVCDFLAKKGLVEGVDISIDVAEQDKPSMIFEIK